MGNQYMVSSFEKNNFNGYTYGKKKNIENKIYKERYIDVKYGNGKSFNPVRIYKIWEGFAVNADRGRH